MQQELLSFIPEYIPLGVVVYDKNGFLKYANNIALKMFGVSMKEVYDINIFNDPNIMDNDKELLKKGLNVSFETDYDFDLCGEQFFDTPIRGIRKYFVTKVTIMKDTEGQRKGYILTCEDITEKKAQEQKIINSYKEIKSTQEDLSLALHTGKLASWNYQVKEGMFYKFNHQIENIEKQSLEYIREQIHPDDREKFLALLDDITHKRKLPNNSIVLKVLNNDDQDYCYYNFTFNAREDETGAITVITFIQQDKTEEIRYQQNLIMAKNKAEEADKLKSTFLANMSHEIRTPLNAIVGFSQLISETTEQEEKNEYKQLIETNSDILLKLIGDILDLSKIEAGSIDIHRQELDLSQLCEELFQSFKQRLKDTNVTLRLINPYAKCTAYFDKHRFIQIFTNFVSNAIKYTPQGEIVMGYECKPGQVRLYVRDTGIGIPEQKKHNIFGRFEKLDNFAQGTGLGLSICKAIAEATKGEVGFESTENVGSEFWYLGYTEVEFVEKSQQTEEKTIRKVIRRTSSNNLPTQMKKLRILIAEDNDSNYLLIKNILKKNLLTRALNGAEAVELAGTQTFDVILMDLRMPLMNGLEATSQIRKFDCQIPIIAITANAFDSDKDAALNAGCNFFMTKPVKRQLLFELLSTLHRKKQIKE